jgi:hypothetical protein
MTPNEAWGLIDKVAIVTGGGAADDGIGNGRAAAILLARVMHVSVDTMFPISVGSAPTSERPRLRRITPATHCGTVISSMTWPSWSL